MLWALDASSKRQKARGRGSKAHPLRAYALSCRLRQSLHRHDHRFQHVHTKASTQSSTKIWLYMTRKCDPREWSTYFIYLSLPLHTHNSPRGVLAAWDDVDHPRWPPCHGTHPCASNQTRSHGTQGMGRQWMRCTHAIPLSVAAAILTLTPIQKQVNAFHQLQW